MYFIYWSCPLLIASHFVIDTCAFEKCLVFMDTGHCTERNKVWITCPRVSCYDSLTLPVALESLVNYPFKVSDHLGLVYSHPLDIAVVLYTGSCMNHLVLNFS